VAEQHLGVPLKCGRCAQTFTTRADAVGVAPAASTVAPVVRLDLGAATSTGRVRQDTENSFLVQHLVCTNLDERRELAVLVIAADRGAAAAGAALTPLLSNVLSGTSKDATEVIAACKTRGTTATVVVVWDGQVHIGHIGDCRIYHQRAGQLMQVTREPMKLAAGDWLIVTGDGLNASVLQGEIAKASLSAAHQAQLLVERAAQLDGSDNCIVVAVRCY